MFAGGNTTDADTSRQARTERFFPQYFGTSISTEPWSMTPWSSVERGLTCIEVKILNMTVVCQLYVGENMWQMTLPTGSSLSVCAQTCCR
jgi:hypothetical protein